MNTIGNLTKNGCIKSIINMLNKHKLSRNIKPEVKLKIRQNSKFGCVVPHCRNSFYEYEHLIPEFKDAKEHDPDKICLVCNNHNPRKTGKKGNENYSKTQLIKYYEQIKSNNQVPLPKNGDFFSGFETEPIIKIGKSTFLNIKSIINIDGTNVFSFQINGDNNPFAPIITFTGKFNDSTGNLLFEIDKNEWISQTYHWDVITKNGVISIKDKSKKLVFEAIKFPNKNTIEITKLDLWFKPFHLKIEEGNLYVGRYSEDKVSWLYLSIAGSFENGFCGVFLDSNSFFNTPVLTDIIMTGGKGATLMGSGIWLGKGSTMRISNISFQFSDKIMMTQMDQIQKNNKVPEGAHYFVKGKLITKQIKYPDWEEEEYYLNNQKLEFIPNSWGQINENGDHLYYIGSNELIDLCENVGFVGFYADDLLNKEWADKVFEVEIKEFNTEGQECAKRIKRAEMSNKIIISELNQETGKYYHPHQFAGCSPWKT